MLDYWETHSRSRYFFAKNRPIDRQVIQLLASSPHWLMTGVRDGEFWLFDVLSFYLPSFCLLIFDNFFKYIGGKGGVVSGPFRRIGTWLHVLTSTGDGYYSRMGPST